MGYKRPRTYVLHCQCLSANLSDSTTYYIHPYDYTPSTNDGFWRYYIPINGTVKHVILNLNPSGGLATAEDVTVSLRVTSTDTALGTVKCNAQNNVLNADCNVAVTTADYIQIKLVTPAWATNPFGLLAVADIFIEYH